MLAASVSAALPHAACAQSIEEIDRLVALSEKPADAIALAQSQADAGSLLEALSTLERTLAVKPKTKQARLMHASLLCRIDDQTGAALEFAHLRSSNFTKAEWDAARTACDPASTKSGQDNDSWQRLRDRRRGF